ncbi:hypothetical protein TVAG_324750 [Trichomonas vaginalis G3]|uniref:Uncharacterized protein n=1 Tax=Trichomonas vaginalis (strain ATCC PRA-98 / G3) TaxID=412133 RepID=A2G024_TRIV3|nr:hypothetical protein TVAGG3_0081390 [Trichomonas vaginalis G3]EAX89496.1 hypothetical protein TVAG_324750 [Trichomonas vaginalis G3]KAI5543271.1 hypothetical protein TVAGG3_0081390 [Trichomonas vaginalis G3]|eukprot:XP_001302426.1 hypothetical protein [Trichomonas vaginalis G3]
MNEEQNTDYISSILNNTGDPDEMYENIGQQVLSMWNSDMETEDLSKSIISQDPLNRIISLLSKSSENLNQNAKEELKSLFEQLTPADYALSGKQLCLALLDFKFKQIETNTKKQKNVIVQVDIPSEIPEQKVIENRKKPKKTSSKPPFRPKVNTITPIQSKSPSQLYGEFPAWLPTMTEF